MTKRTTKLTLAGTTSAPALDAAALEHAAPVDFDTPEAMAATIRALQLDAKRRDKEFLTSMEIAGKEAARLKDQIKTLTGERNALSRKVEKLNDRIEEMRTEADAYRREIADMGERLKTEIERTNVAAEAATVDAITAALHKMQAVSDALEIPRKSGSSAGSMDGQDHGLPFQDHYALQSAKFSLRGLLFAADAFISDRVRNGKTEYGSLNRLNYQTRLMDQIREDQQRYGDSEDGQVTIRGKRISVVQAETDHFMAQTYHEEIAQPIQRLLFGLYESVTGENAEATLEQAKGKRRTDEKPVGADADKAAKLRALMGR